MAWGVLEGKFPLIHYQNTCQNMTLMQIRLCQGDIHNSYCPMMARNHFVIKPAGAPKNPLYCGARRSHSKTLRAFKQIQL